MTREEIDAEAWIGTQRERVTALLDELEATKAKAGRLQEALEKAESRLRTCSFCQDEPESFLARAALAETEDVAAWLSEREAKVREEAEAFFHAQLTSPSVAGDNEVIAEHDARVRAAALEEAVACMQRGADALSPIDSIAANVRALASPAPAAKHDPTTCRREPCPDCASAGKEVKP